MVKLLVAAGCVVAALALLAPAGAWFVDARMSRDVILITPAAPEIVELNKAMWSRGEPVAPIYGEAVDKPIRVVRPDARDVIVPEEDPSLLLMSAGGARRPLQVQTVWVAVKYGTPAGLVAGVAMLALAAVLRRRRRKAGGPLPGEGPARQA